jgi:hypothetical protein
MTGKDHPCANKPIVFGSFIQHLARPSYLPRPSELVSKCEIQTKVGQLAVRLTLFLHHLYLVILTPLEGKKYFTCVYTRSVLIFLSFRSIYEIYFMKTMVYETRNAILNKGQGFPPHC